MCGVSTWRHTLLARARIKSHVLPLIQTAVYTFIGEKKKTVGVCSNKGYKTGE